MCIRDRPRGVHAPGVGEAAEVVVRRAPPRRLLRLARRALSPLQPRACTRRRRRKRDPRPRWARRLAPLVGPSGPFGSGPSRVVCIAAFQVAFPMLLDSPLRLLSPFLSRNSSASRQLPSLDRIFTRMSKAASNLKAGAHARAYKPHNETTVRANNAGPKGHAPLGVQRLR